MVNPNFEADLCASVPSEASPKTGELEQRLGLYQVFLKLYEHHRELLDEILDLENTDRYRVRGVWQYIQAGVERDHAYIITNLLKGKSQKLFQPQHTWVIGRDPSAGLPLQDKRLSRRHALIQYVLGRGFYLKDLNSTNGTYLNGEPLRRPTLLKDGDRIRLGSLFFIFFVDSGSRTLAKTNVASKPIDKIITTESDPQANDPAENRPELDGASIADEAELPLGSEKETFLFPQPFLDREASHHASDTSDLSTAQKADILDRFLNR